MITQQLLDFIKLQLKMGASKDDIQKTLASSNWTQQDIDQAFAMVENSQATSVPPQPGVPSAPTAAAQGSYANTSGHGKDSIVPDEIKRWNWGAFGLNWIWGIGNGTFIALLCFIPLVNLVMIFVLGAKGSEWAWRNERWESVEHFKRVQRRWTIAWLILVVVFVLIFAAELFFVLGPLSSSLNSDREKGLDVVRMSDLNEIQVDLEIYDSQNGSYPQSLSQLAQQPGSSVPVDPQTQLPFQYQSTGSSYTLCAKLEEDTPPITVPPNATFSKGEYCLTPGSSASNTGSGAASSTLE